MENVVNAGSLLIETGSDLPRTVRIECDRFSETWETLVWPDRRAFEKELAAAGWSLFYLAGRTTATVFGFHKERTLQRAADRVLAQISSHGFNCAEITAVLTKSFCRIPYVTVSAHARHIQQGMVLSGRKHCARRSGTATVAAAASE